MKTARDPRGARCSARSPDARTAGRRGAPTSRARRISRTASSMPGTQSAPAEARSASPRGRARTGKSATSASTRRSIRTSPTASAGSSRSIRSSPRPSRSSARRSAAAATRARRRRSAPDGRLAIYTGDDKAFEYIYKFVSRDRVDRRSHEEPRRSSTTARSTSRGSTTTAAASGCRSCTDRAASPPANGFRDQAEVLVKTRMAARRASARRRWTGRSGSPSTRSTREVVVTLTNNADRGAQGPSGTRRRESARQQSPRPASFAGAKRTTTRRPRHSAGTCWRWPAIPTRPTRPGRAASRAMRSPIRTACASTRRGGCGCMTDVSPSRLNKGEFEPVRQQPAACGRSRDGRVPALPDRTRRLRDHRDRVHTRRPHGFRQHPASGRDRRRSERSQGAQQDSNWPDFRRDGRPRSATIVIRRTDGGAIGS